MASGSGDPVDAYVALGANLGQPLATLRTATAAIEALPSTRLIASSAVYRTRPVDAVGPDFLNAVVRIETQLAPHDLLQQLLDIERLHGRDRPRRNAPRTIDLDLLIHGETRLDTPTLSLPHPRMHLRAFVLAPLLDVWPADARIEGRQRMQVLLAGLGHQTIDRLDDPLRP